MSEAEIAYVERAPSELANTRFAKIRHFESLDSTNTYLAGLARKQFVTNVVALTDHQTAGKGRRDRSWIAPPQTSMLCSVLVEDVESENIAWSTQAVALSVLDACAIGYGVRAAIKWPNDIMVDDRKLGGVLAERITAADGRTQLVVGCGVNLLQRHDLSHEWQKSAIALVECLEMRGDNVVTTNELEKGNHIDVMDFTVAYLRALDARMRHPEWLLDAYRLRCSTVGQYVRVLDQNDRYEGLAVGIAQDGALCVECSAPEGDPNGDTPTRRILHAGDIVQLRHQNATERENACRVQQ